MKRTLAILSLLLFIAQQVRADVPPINPEERARRTVARVLAQVVTHVTALNKSDDGAAKADFQKKIEASIKGLDAAQLKIFKELIADRESALNKLLDAAADQADKDKIQEQLKPYKTLRERFLQASVETDNGTASVQSNAVDLSRAAMLFAGLAMTLAFASAGIIYKRKNG